MEHIVTFLTLQKKKQKLMEDELQRKLHLNSRLLKEKLKGRWEKIAEILPHEIIKPRDFRNVISLPSDREKVDLMLRMLFRSKKCQRFIEVLERNGFSDVCGKIKETDFQGSTENKATRDKTFVRENKADEAKSIARVIEQAVESIWIIFEERMDKKLEEFMKKVQDELKSRNFKLEEKGAKYSMLKDAYTDGYKNVYSPTIWSQKQNREYHILMENKRLISTRIAEESEDNLDVLSTTNEDKSLTGRRHSSVDSQDSGHVEVKFSRP